jgi:hypothetical protein
VYHRDRDNLYKSMEIPLVDALVSVAVVRIICFMTVFLTVIFLFPPPG